MEEHKTTLISAFEECAAKRAAFQTAVICARGNIDDQFFEFHASLSLLYNLSLPNAVVMNQPHEGTATLSESIYSWLTTVRSYRGGAAGGKLFEALVAALADAGLV